LDHPGITLCALPYYPNLYQLWRADPRIYLEIHRMVRQHAPNWDAILISGPHPIGQMVARECVALGVPVALIVRQNLVQQMSAHHGLKRRAAVTAAEVLEWDFKRLARGRTVFTVGMEMAEAYRRFSHRVYDHFPCLVDEAQLQMFSAMSADTDPTRLLCVCRLAPEKGHRYLFEALVQLRSHGLVCQLDVVGTGPLEHELRARAAALGLDAQVTFRGYVPYGPALFDLYQRAGALVLSSLTEAFPQVISEALCIGLPTVATTVGDIPTFLTDGETSLLVPPGDVGALAGAIERVVLDGDLRQRLRRNGRALMRDNTLEANRARVMKVLRDEVLPAHA
jgi:glycosyltransferase involved in cell wall biosynthesis